MSRASGKFLSEDDHIAQSVVDILTTPKGSRVGLRDYGSKLFSLLDQNPSKMDLYIACYEALDLWEKRFELKKVTLVESSESGQVVVELEGFIRGKTRILSVGLANNG
jgi:phage baseplate assembly protein W